MKLIYPEIESVINFSTGAFSAVIIENSGLFYRFVQDLQRQCCGDDGVAVLSVDDSPVPIGGNLDLLIDFFAFEINRKTLLNKIVAQLEKRALDSEFYERSQQLLAQIETLIYDLAFQNDVEVELSRLSVGALLKAVGLSLKEEYRNLAEKLLVYMDLMNSVGQTSAFVLVNLRSFLGGPLLELSADSCCGKGYHVLLIDNKTYPKLSREERIVIDADLCEF